MVRPVRRLLALPDSETRLVSVVLRVPWFTRVPRMMGTALLLCSFFFSSRRRHTRLVSDWSSDVCSSDLPCPGVFSSLDLLLIDLQDVGSRYYTYAATAVWAAEAALAAGCEVWVLD